MKLKFHYRLIQGGERENATRHGAHSRDATGLPEPLAQAAFCKEAEELGFSGLLVDVGAKKPDPILVAAAVGPLTEKIEFIIAYRSGMIPPTTFVQQLNTLSSLIGGRLSLNIVAGHSPRENRYYGDFADHDTRYARTGEFLDICRRFWGGGEVNVKGRFYHIEGGRLNTPFVAPKRQAPELFISGGSKPARDLAMAHGDVWMFLPDTPQQVAARVTPVLNAGKEAGLRFSIIVRDTRAQAHDAARALVAEARAKQSENGAENRFISESDSVCLRGAWDLAEHEWLTPTLWTGAVRSHGGPAIALVGDVEDVAEALAEFVRAGVSQFILSGWPKLETMRRLGREVMPLVRRKTADLVTA